MDQLWSSMPGHFLFKADSKEGSRIRPPCPIPTSSPMYIALFIFSRPTSQLSLHRDTADYCHRKSIIPKGRDSKRHRVSHGIRWKHSHLDKILVTEVEPVDAGTMHFANGFDGVDLVVAFIIHVLLIARNCKLSSIAHRMPSTDSMLLKCKQRCLRIGNLIEDTSFGIEGRWFSSTS